MAELCDACNGGPEGATGHGELSRQIDDTMLGHTIFECRRCGERWIRRLGFTGGFAWTRYSQQFAGRKRPVPFGS